jgi:hypothetical protein
MLTELARNWLSYARRVARCPDHLRFCDAPNISDIDGAIRWPGFVGLRYELSPKRLLLVGRIHNPTGWSGWPGLGALEPLIRAWLHAEISDEAFFNDYNSEYARRLVAWGPWRKVYARLANAAGTDVSGIAYTNIAKCWQYPGKETSRQRACSKAFPLRDLVEVLKPHGVFLLAPNVWVSQVPGAAAGDVPFMNDSAPHFQLPANRIQAAQMWVKGLQAE